ncbi:MAG TPA: CotH kinase family protein, partial [Candidatus Saccharimonadales bacterium]|nr:CotH kinase family protein [Candidatus Saccharimonadales bacterium]
GSPWTRGGGLDRPKFKLPGDRLFRAHDHMYYDIDPAGGNFHNRVTRYWLYLMGYPVNENEIVRVIINNYGIDIREDTEPVHNDFVSRSFRDGNRGHLYRVDDEWWFMDNWERDSQDADWRYKGSENPGRYRTEWMKRSNEVEDDFTHLISFFKLMSANPLNTSAIERVLDIDALLKYTVVRGYIADWDTFTMGRGKNCFFYERPDGKFQFLHWDSDLGFGDPNSGFYGGRVAPLIDRPVYKRRFHYWLGQFHENFSKNSLRFETWLQAEEDASRSYSSNPAFYTNYCNSRAAAVLRELGKSYTAKLDLKSLNPSNLVTNETVTITGTAPSTLYSVRFLPDPGTNFVWRDESSWRASKLPLKAGTNHFEIQGLDINGKVVSRAGTDIVRTNALGGP